MARINIEDCWWTDPRRSALGRALGGEEIADGVAVRAWRLGQEFWKKGRMLVPLELFQTLHGYEALLKVGLADVRESFVYVRGSSAYLDWVAERTKNAREAGKKSAQSRKEKLGSAQPKREKPRTTLEPVPNEPRTKTNDTEPSVSVSSSSSVSGSFSESLYSVGGETTSSHAPVAEIKSPAAFFIGTYVKAYQKQHGDKARPELTGKVQSQIKAYLSEVPIERACQMITKYCEMRDEWFLTKAHDFGTFIQNLSKVGVALDTGSAPNRTSSRLASKESHAQDQLKRIAEGSL